jgi:hypothetical protein
MHNEIYASRIGIAAHAASIVLQQPVESDTHNGRPSYGAGVVGFKLQAVIHNRTYGATLDLFCPLRDAIKHGRRLTPKVRLTQAVPAGPHTMTSPCQTLILRASTEDSCSLKRNALDISNVNATTGTPPCGLLIS